MKKAKSYLKGFNLVKFKTQKLISKSAIILFFDTSAIVDAIFLRKKIVCVQSNIFYGKKYNSDLYKDILNLKSIHLDNDNNKNLKIINELIKKKVINYNKYIKNYAGSDIFNSGEKQIVNFLKKNYY